MIYGLRLKTLSTTRNFLGSSWRRKIGLLDNVVSCFITPFRRSFVDIELRKQTHPQPTNPDWREREREKPNTWWVEKKSVGCWLPRGSSGHFSRRNFFFFSNGSMTDWEMKEKLFLFFFGRMFFSTPKSFGSHQIRERTFEDIRTNLTCCKFSHFAVMTENWQMVKKKVLRNNTKTFLCPVAHFLTRLPKIGLGQLNHSSSWKNEIVEITP